VIQSSVIASDEEESFDDKNPQVMQHVRNLTDAEIFQRVFVSTTSFDGHTDNTGVLSGCSQSKCPDVALLRWVREPTTALASDLRSRLVRGCHAITRAAVAVAGAETPLGMLYVPSCKDIFKHTVLSKALSESDEKSSNSWRVHFMCDDSRPVVSAEKKPFAHEAVSLSRDAHLFQEALPLLKATIALIMCHKLMSDSVDLHLPYNVTALSPQFDTASLVVLFNYYEHFAREARTAGKTPTRKNGKNPDNEDTILSLVSLVYHK
jgi:hypothetical protein